MTSARIVKLRNPQRVPIVPAKDVGEAVHNLLRSGWTRLEYPTLSRRFETLASTFTAMTNDERRCDYVVPDARELDRQSEPDLGLIENAKGQLKLKPRADEIAEQRLRYDSTKFKHQFKPRLLGYLGRYPGRVERHAEFFLDNARMYGEATLLLLEITEELDRRLPGYRFVERVREADHHHLLRQLRYLCDGPTPDIAMGHRDQDFITIHNRSDRGGLWVVDNDGNIIAEVEETSANSILIFFGRKAWQMTRGKLQGIMHGAKDITFSDLTGRMPRQTSVFFGHVCETDEESTFLHNNASKLVFPDHVKRWIAT